MLILKVGRLFLLKKIGVKYLILPFIYFGFGLINTVSERKSNARNEYRLDGRIIFILKRVWLSPGDSP